MVKWVSKRLCVSSHLKPKTDESRSEDWVSQPRGLLLFQGTRMCRRRSKSAGAHQLAGSVGTSNKGWNDVAEASHVGGEVYGSTQIAEAQRCSGRSKREKSRSSKSLRRFNFTFTA